MHRIYEPAAYQTQAGCYWDTTVTPPDCAPLETDTRVEVAVIGGGYTGLNAALTLAAAGVETAVLDAETPGWGASGRNGGFCCLGGAKLGGAALKRRVGAEAAAEWHRTEVAAIETVRATLDTNAIDADTHSHGETLLAHNERQWAALRKAAPEVTAQYGVTPELIPPNELRQHGLNGDFHGALTTRLGFALNPRKYHAGLARAAREAGVALHGRTPVTALTREAEGWRLDTPAATLRARRVVVATNGYSSEDVPAWMRARYLPVQSSVIVTRPLTDDDLAAQGWTSDQMSYDTRALLHYFRLLPERRFLFGMRGGLRATPAAETAIRARIRRSFARLFPAWRDVEITHDWSGLLCLTAGLAPFTGPVPEMPGVFASFGYHGNGVAMASHLGHRLAQHMTGQGPALPRLVTRPPRRFPLGASRRLLLAPAYFTAETLDL